MNKKNTMGFTMDRHTKDVLDRVSTERRLNNLSMALRQIVQEWEYWSKIVKIDELPHPADADPVKLMLVHGQQTSVNQAVSND
jgi:hypothetical protein